MTLKRLAENFLDGKVVGNRDQIVANFIYEKYKDMDEKYIDSKIDTAIRNFDSKILTVQKERHRKLLK